MIERFLKTYKDGGMVYLDPTERDRIVEEINRLKKIDESHQRLNGKLREEIERLNNIINELEKGIENMWVDNTGEDTWEYEEEFCLYRKEFLDKIKELKGRR